MTENNDHNILFLMENIFNGFLSNVLWVGTYRYKCSVYSQGKIFLESCRVPVQKTLCHMVVCLLKAGHRANLTACLVLRCGNLSEILCESGTAKSTRHNVDTDIRMKINNRTCVCLDTLQFSGWPFLSLLVELVLLLVLFDDGLVGLFKVFGQDDIPVLTHCQHASLGQQRKI